MGCIEVLTLAIIRIGLSQSNKICLYFVKDRSETVGVMLWEVVSAWDLDESCVCDLVWGDSLLFKYDISF